MHSSARLLVWALRIAAAATVALAACSLGEDFSSLSAGTGAEPPVPGDDGAAAADGGSLDASVVIAPLADAGLPPPPPTCKMEGLACVPVAPAGWAGPFALYAGSVADAPACSGGLTSVLQASGSLAPAAPAICASCACSAATGMTCGSVTVAGAAASCSCANTFAMPLALGTCTNLSYGSLICDGFAADTVNFTVSPASGGQCTPAPAKPTAQRPNVIWGSAAVGCQLSVPSQVDCPANQVCASTPAPPFDPRQCIMKAGDVAACPGFPYSRRSLFYRGVDDKRDCAACACGSPGAASCATSVKTAANFGCADTPFVTAPACQPRSSPARYNVMATATPPTNVACAASGGAPIGGVTTKDPVTICCME